MGTRAQSHVDAGINIGIGIVGGGYMGKAHAVAMGAVGAVFNTRLRPTLEMICTTSKEGARAKAQAFGFKRATDRWQELVMAPEVEAVVIASPPHTHLPITKLAVEHNKPVLCEKPLGGTLDNARTMVALADGAGIANMTGFNYIRTPASQLAREMIAAGEIGEVTSFRGEHTEDFYADPNQPATWRARGQANGTMGDLAPHMINAALTLVGNISELVADIHTLVRTRPPARGAGQDQPVETVENDDFGQLLCRFENGACGQMLFSRVAHGRKMGYIYEITGHKGALRFNQEDQNSLWYYDAQTRPARAGFRQILTGPEHPDYVNFCLGPGHGTGYQDQIIIEARDFLAAIETGTPVFPTFQDGLAAAEVASAAFLSNRERRWVRLSEI